MSLERLAVFAYGSLAGATSAARTLGRPVAELQAARLAGWRRRWSLARDNMRSEKTFARTDDGSVPPFFLGLNIEPGEGAEGPNGALLEVSEEELDRLDRREMRYDRLDVTDAVAPAGDRSFDRVFAYVAKRRHHHPTPPGGAVINAAYLHAVETAFASLGPGQLDVYRTTTEPSSVEVVEAVLVRDQIPEGNPREW